jgi:hypothetical protein
MHLVVVSPEIEKLFGELAAVVYKYPYGRTTTFNELVIDTDGNPPISGGTEK